jgi:BMFP domain-containing protein YqiC
MMAMTIFMRLAPVDAARRIARRDGARLRQPVLSRFNGGLAAGLFRQRCAANADGLPPASPTSSVHCRRTDMIDLNHIDDLARRLSQLVPPGLRDSQEELQQTFKSALQAGLGKLDLVTREEFDVQQAVLLRTREKLETLERTVAALETQLADKPAQS